MTAISTGQMIGVVGAGTMGGGIAQLAAAAGHPVVLFDAFDGAADKGKERIKSGLDRLVSCGKMAAEDAGALLDRITVVPTIDALADAAMVVEAIVEKLEVKQGLFKELEAVLAPDAILGTNTSSISITSIACGLAHPERVVGMHFFNPAPVMKLVEVISGVTTDPAVAEAVFDTAQNWGKVAVHAKSTPGFIVNRVARPYYAEALRLYEEQVADPATIDALLTEGAGFRMGPFALMDLIGNDVNYTVCKSVFDLYYQEPRFRPSIVQLELVNAGRLGQKSGHGYYDYSDGTQKPAPKTEPVTEVALLDGFALGGVKNIDGVIFMPTDGRRASEMQWQLKQPVVVYDYFDPTSKRVGFAVSSDLADGVIDRFVATLGSQGVQSTKLPDWPGLVGMRTIAMLANEGFEAAMQGVASHEGVDNAMRFGVNYPRGPIAWAREIGLHRVIAVLDNIYSITLDPRYRASLALRMAKEDE
jgi:3-hydroxybutyryl-CoA dehydrogenase